MNPRDPQKPTVGIVGFGAFGLFAARHLVGACGRVLVFDEQDRSVEAASVGAAGASLSDVGACEVVVIAVPVQAMEGALRAVRGHIRSGALVVDVASVKVKAMELMLRLVPPDAEVIGTHPLLGPQSGKHGIAGLPIALCPGRNEPSTMDRLAGFLSVTLGLRVVHTTPDAHDRAMAYVQALTHLISRAAGEMDLPETPMATVAYQRLLAMKANLQHDSWELFAAIENENPYAGEVRALLRNKLEDLERRLSNHV